MSELVHALWCPLRTRWRQRRYGQPLWRDDRSALMLGISQYGCPRCGRGAAETGRKCAQSADAYRPTTEGASEMSGLRAGPVAERREGHPMTTPDPITPGEPNLFDTIQTKAKEIVVFHMVSHGMTPEFTDEEADAIELGMSSGIHAAIEHFMGAKP